MEKRGNLDSISIRNEYGKYSGAEAKRRFLIPLFITVACFILVGLCFGVHILIAFFQSRAQASDALFSIEYYIAVIFTTIGFGLSTFAFSYVAFKRAKKEAVVYAKGIVCKALEKRSEIRSSDNFKFVFETCVNVISELGLAQNMGDIVANFESCAKMVETDLPGFEEIVGNTSIASCQHYSQGPFAKGRFADTGIECSAGTAEPEKTEDGIFFACLDHFMDEIVPVISGFSSICQYYLDDLIDSGKFRSVFYDDILPVHFMARLLKRLEYIDYSDVVIEWAIARNQKWNAEENADGK